MKLANGTLRPGRVIEVCKCGNIKVEAPGLFSAEDKDNLPEVMPFFTNHANSFSSVREGDEVWVLNQSDNPMDLRWFRKDEYEVNDENYADAKDIEIVFNRANGEGWAMIMYDDGNGIMLQNKDCYINITQNGYIILDTQKTSRAISIIDGSISLGKAGKKADHPAGYGDEIQSCLQTICTILSNVSTAAKSNSMTLPIATAIDTNIQDLITNVPKTVSTNVTLD